MEIIKGSTQLITKILGMNIGVADFTPMVARPQYLRYLSVVIALKKSVSM